MGDADKQETGFQGFAHNQPATQPFVHAVGSLITSFGTIEYALDAWLDGLSGGSRPTSDPAFKNRFQRRVELVLKLLGQTQVPPDLVEEARSLWKRAQKLSRLRRNPVAHGYCVFGWHGAKKEGPPHHVGFFDPETGVLVRLKDLVKGAEEAAGISQEIQALEKKIAPLVSPRNLTRRGAPAALEPPESPSVRRPAGISLRPREGLRPL
jgi:hypothetical protein